MQREVRGQPAIEIGPCSTTGLDTAELVALFRRSFAPVPTIFQPRSRRRWVWKYNANPSGCASLSARIDGCAIAHVGGVPCRSRWGERSTRAIQATDHMIDPLWRRGLRAGELFRRLMGAWVERYCSAASHVLGWGFPSAHDFRIGERFFGYANLGFVRILVHDDLGLLLQRDSSPAELLAAPEHCAAPLDDLWRRCRAVLPLTHERDAAFLLWRYAQHPTRRYELLALRGVDGALRAVAVLRRGGLAADTATLLEWLVDPADPDAATPLLDLAARRALALGCSALAVWCAPWRRDSEALRRAGFAERDSALRHTARCFDPRLSLADLREGCAWSLGDVDFL